VDSQLSLQPQSTNAMLAIETGWGLGRVQIASVDFNWSVRSHYPLRSYTIQLNMSCREILSQEKFMTIADKSQ
jgi:hypothetical protein